MICARTRTGLLGAARSRVGRSLCALKVAPAWLESAELPPPPPDTLPGVQAFDVELLRRQTLRSVQVGDGDYEPALMRLRYLAALARPEELPQPPRRRQD